MNLVNQDRKHSLGPWAALLAGTVLAAHGCGDGPICPPEVVVVISSIADGATITTDTSPDPGIQIDVPVRTNLQPGEQITLTVLDATGAEVANLQATTDDTGEAQFTAVTMPEGLTILRAESAGGECGKGFDEVQVNVVAGGGCGLAIREGLLDSDYYAPLKVLNSINDSDPALPNFQANIDISSSPDFNVELFVLDIDAASEISAGVITTGANGMATFTITLAQGRQTLRATCNPASGGLGASSANTPVLVDTEIPACSFAYPTPGTTVIPPMDEDNDPTNGTQLTLMGHADAGASDDVEGETARFSMNGAPVEGTLVDAAGDSSLAVTFDTVGAYSLVFETQDHAGNLCTASQTSSYVTDGCAIALLQPTAPVTSDGDGDPTNGMQTEIIVQVDVACAGQTVTTDCGEGVTTATVPPDGTTSIDVTVCPNAQCEVTDMCTISVTNDAGIQTSVGTDLVADNTAPQVSLQFINPVVSCGGAVAPSADVDADPTNGVQIDIRVVSPLSSVRWAEVTDAMGATVTTPSAVGGDTRVTLGPGANDIVGVAEDLYGNQGRTAVCPMALLDIVIGFAPPVDDGLVGSVDGAVVGSQITFDLCGTVSEAGTTIDVSIDGNPTQAATVMGTDWCLYGVTLSESTAGNPFHTVDVSASTGVRFGAGSIDVVVDLTAGPPVGSFSAAANTRQSIAMSWIAPSDNGQPAAAYALRIADVPISDANFDVVGTVVPGPVPSAPGVTDTFTIEQLFAGHPYYVAVATVDPAGNRSLPMSAGPLTPRFDGTGGIPAVDPSAGDNGLGFQVAHGDFNADGYRDLAVSAPFKSVDLNNNGMFDPGESGVGVVYVYYGGPAGLGNPLDPPDVTFRGATSGGQFGNGLASLEWGGDMATDLAIGVPFGDNSNGRVYVFFGAAGTGFGPGGTSANANVTIGSAGGWFGYGAIGWTLARARFNSDAFDDLAIAVPGGGAGNGGIAVVYGGHTETSIMLSELNPVPSGTARTLVIRDPDPALFDLFGQTVVNLGHTQGAGDVNDDLGVAYFDGNSVHVIRGRAKPGNAGVTLGNINPAVDLEIVDDSVDATEVHFGSSMGSIEDQNNDNARDLVIGSWAEGNFDGRVRIVDGDAVGVQNVATLALTTITHGVSTARHFGAAVVNNATSLTNADVNADGMEDLLIVGGFGNTVSMFMWFGGAIPTGNVTSASAAHVRAAPIAFDSNLTTSSATPIVAIWAGDVNGDGLGDICWADFTANARDGVFEVLWDDGL